MVLYLVQHAEAKSKEEDPERDLTEKGRRDLERVARYLKRLHVQVGHIFHSGKTRAHSTAKILAQQVQPAAGVSEAPGLKPMDDPETWAERVADLEEDTLLVGHLPHLGKLASLLTSGDQEKGVVNFQMGGVVRLRRDEGNWGVDWMMVPDIVL
jgi:phosphohistidine phosphatase